MAHDFVTALIPSLGASLQPRFNVFDVMHHGTYEKQLSNVFAWLLTPNGTHGLGDRFVHIFCHQTNKVAEGDKHVPTAGYEVKQEVPIATDDSLDIMDLVLERPDACIAVENYFTSDGHGHAFRGYQGYASRFGRAGVVVLLCQQVDRSRIADGWEDAVILTYNDLLSELIATINHDQRYQRANEDAWWFIRQMHQRFEEGTQPMSDEGLLEFVLAMCDSREAIRYQTRSIDTAADAFAADVANQARAQFLASRDMLHRAKVSLKHYCAGSLAQQFERSHGRKMISSVKTNFAGIYVWTVNVSLDREEQAHLVSLMLGPTAWFACNGDDELEEAAPLAPDYSKLLLVSWNPRKLQVSDVSLQEVMDGLEPTDMRLHDELTDFLHSLDGTVLDAPNAALPTVYGDQD